MYAAVLTLHSWFRWLVLVSLIVTLYRAYSGWRNHRSFSGLDNTLRHTTATIAHVQLILGITLYFLSPIVSYFLNNFGEGVHLREIRFFGMEHIVMMLTAVTVITIGSIKTKQKSTDREKFKTMAIWYGIGLFLILVSIPWGILFLVSRPLLRSF